MSDSVPQYGRWQHVFDADSQPEAVVFTAPDGEQTRRPAFRHQPAELTYDRHGYESVQPAGPEVAAVRFTPERPGPYRWAAIGQGRTLAEGEFTCQGSDHPGYVEVSGRDGRYFAFTDGSSYCPIGVNLCWPVYYPLSRGTEFETTDRRGTMGVSDYRRWFAAMAAEGGNFTRIWCSSPALSVDTERAGELDLAAFARLDAIVELARRHGIRLKLCLEHFRTIEPGSPYHSFRVSHPAFCKTLCAPDGSPPPATVDQWFTDPTWQRPWLGKLDAYTARYGDDPVVMCWELWNEINAVKSSSFEIVRDWTLRTLAEVRRRSPRNLATNSLGSFDRDERFGNYGAFKADELDFQQAHRYLDQGAQLDICHDDPVALAIDAVAHARRDDRPCILAETGAVNDNHTGQFRFYRVDHEGMLLHDVTAPPLFAHAAGSGHSWFWEHYVEPHQLWHHLRPLADAVAGVQLDAEGFEAIDLSTEHAWALGLLGRRTILLWLRSKRHTWQRVLRDLEPVEMLQPFALQLPDTGATDLAAKVIPCWPLEVDLPLTLPVQAGRIELPAFTRGMILRIDRP